MSQAGAAGFPVGAAQQDGSKHMQRIFLDAMAKYCDDFMRSPQFLQALKQTMDNAMAFKQQMDGMMTQALRGAQVATQKDAEYSAELLHGFERRLTHRLDALSERLDALEHGGRRTAKRSDGTNGAARSAPRRSGRRTAKSAR